MAVRPQSIWSRRKKVDREEIIEFKKDLDLDFKILELLLIRGISSYEEAKKFFRPEFDQLHDPFLMQDMTTAVQRIDQARKKDEKVLIYGDYDVDGTTAVSLVAGFFTKHYNRFETYIPDRYREGYGVSTKGIDYAKSIGASLIIALDCGIKAIDKVDYARSMDIDFIICDHHNPGPILPKAVAVLDPKREDCEYPYKGLSGCGVGFKLCQALANAWDLDESEFRPGLDLLTLSIGADIVPMTGENRVLAHYGLKKINEDPSPGIRALLQAAGVHTKRLDIGDVVFTLAPRINAAGRLDHGKMAVNLLTGNDLSTLPEIAREIDRRNTERKQLDKKISAEALLQIEDQIASEACSTVVFQQDWHKGVIGIVASRLIESYYRPTVVLTRSGDVLAGSARSVSGFDLYDALSECEPHLIQFGGHAAAAGMTMKEEQLSQFKIAFEKSVANRIEPDQKQPSYLFDLEVSAEDLDKKFHKMLQYFAPFGPENLAPLLLIKGLQNHGSRTVGEGQKHLKLQLVDPESGIILDGIAFNRGDQLPLVQRTSSLALLFHLELNEFRGQSNLQMRVMDFKSEDELIDNI